MWEIVTTFDNKKRAIMVLLDALKGNIETEKAVCDICVEELNTDNGMTVLFQKLIFLKMKPLMKHVMHIPNLSHFKDNWKCQ